MGWSQVSCFGPRLDYPPKANNNDLWTFLTHLASTGNDRQKIDKKMSLTTGWKDLWFAYPFLMLQDGVTLVSDELR